MPFFGSLFINGNLLRYCRYCRMHINVYLELLFKNLLKGLQLGGNF